MNFYSQSEQDKWVIKTLDNKRNGFFLDIGAYDGIQTSNTYTLETELGWSGICIEANPIVFNALLRNRKAKCLHVAILDYNGECEFGTDAINKPPFTIIPCDTLENILETNNAPTEIDYLSIDIEGCEYLAFKNFPFDKWKIKLMTVEHNSYLDGTNKQEELFELLSKKGFIRAVKDAVCLDTNPLYFNKPYEDWYINQFLKL